ncbi:hypothetical protein SAR116_1887 [Candidatus Puniceispirillum marinum IMCC1322]|uniref:Uncharacterized protein n=1 Tax=Puniceispirillum marinum (strain IMCC1322) TaxID=488538 RepID=D5BMT7_PUNMI|nr:hypothetical protein SAR116_1887 [Candidatus Puniceispirillum marinum IMCC1322]
MRVKSRPFVASMARLTPVDPETVNQSCFLMRLYMPKSILESNIFPCRLAAWLYGDRVSGHQRVGISDLLMLGKAGLE